MQRKLPPLNSLRAFEAVARYGSVVKAAKELNVTHSAISQQIKLLENYLNLPLLHRSGGKISLLEYAKPYASELSSVFTLIHHATSQLLSVNNEQILTINLLSTFAMRWLIPRLENFQSHNPQIEIRISTPTREVNFEKESIDLAVYYGAGDWPLLHADFLFHDYFCCVTSAKLYSKLKHMDWNLILQEGKFIYVSAPMRKNVWQLWFKSLGLTEPAISNRIYFENSIQALEAAINGLGIGLASELFIQEDLAAKRLFLLHKQKIKSPHSFYLVCPKEYLEKTKIKLFRQWIVSQCLSI